MAPRLPRVAHNGLLEAPRPPRDGSRWLRSLPRIRPRRKSFENTVCQRVLPPVFSLHDGLPRPPDVPKSPRRPRRAQKGSKTAQTALRGAPRASQESPKWRCFEAQEGQRQSAPPCFSIDRLQDGPQGPPRLPRRREESLERAPQAPERTPKESMSKSTLAKCSNNTSVCRPPGIVGSAWAGEDRRNVRNIQS